ncbi:MAG TPA: hypothetical protein VIQ31_00460, partial [Phormidium sp.]
SIGITMINPVEQFFEYIKNHTDEKLPIAVVVRADLYEQLMSSPEVQTRDTTSDTNNFLSFPKPIPRATFKVLVDPASDDPFMAQTEECQFFYDNEMLTAYLNRVEDPDTWLRLFCESANISYPDQYRYSDMDLEAGALDKKSFRDMTPEDILESLKTLELNDNYTD